MPQPNHRHHRQLPRRVYPHRLSRLRQTPEHLHCPRKPNLHLRRKRPLHPRHDHFTHGPRRLLRKPIHSPFHRHHSRCTCFHQLPESHRNYLTQSSGNHQRLRFLPMRISHLHQPSRHCLEYRRVRLSALLPPDTLTNTGRRHPPPKTSSLPSAKLTGTHLLRKRPFNGRRCLPRLGF